VSAPATDVVVVVVSHETRDLTLACVRGLLAAAESSSLAIRVVVVDTASGDGSAEALGELVDTRLEVVASSENLGFGRACNVGAARRPDAEFVLVLNADTEVSAEAIERLVDTLRTDPELGVVGPEIVDDGGRLRATGRGDPTRLALLHQHTALRYLKVGRGAYAAYKSPAAAAGDGDRDVDVLNGAALMLPGPLFRELGGFDESFFLYFEEADLCRRVRAAGRRVRWVRSARIVHAGGASSGGKPELSFGWYLESLFRYVDTWSGRAGGLVFRLVFKPLFLVKMLVDVLRDAGAWLIQEHRRVDKEGELRLAAHFFSSGLWRFLAA
jgi:GT2 family glycosyltransferase